MKMNSNNKICIVSPFPPPVGGMAVQADKLATLLENDGFKILKVATNVEMPKGLKFLSAIPFIRTIIRQILFLLNLNAVLSEVKVIYFLTGFFNFFFWVTYPALILMLIRNKPIILSARGGNARIFFQKYKLLIKPIFERLYAITVPSGFLKVVFKEELNIETTTVPNIADLVQFSFVKRNTFEPNLIVTRSLEKIYDLQTVIKAFSVVKEKYPNAQLGIVGDGSLKKLLIKQVQDLLIKKNVKFYGEINHKDIHRIYKEYDIFINASKVDNFPGSILEAFAAGLPVISTNAGGIPYMVVNKENGLLSDIEDYKTLAKNVIKLIENPDLGKALAMKGYIELQKYTWPHIKPIFNSLLIDER